MDKLFLEYRNNKDLKLREKIILNYLFLVDKLASRYRCFKNIYEDIKQVGYIGLIKAVEGYDIARRTEFTTYASHCILGEIRHFLRDKVLEVKATRNLFGLAKEIDKFIDYYLHNYYRPPTLEEISQRFMIPVKDIIFALNIKKIQNIAEINESKLECPGYETFKLPLEDKIVLIQALERLEKVERKIIYMFFYLDLTQTEIGKIIGARQRKISKIIDGSLKKLKNILKYSFLK